jgi:hypothetical protein
MPAGFAFDATPGCSGIAGAYSETRSAKGNDARSGSAVGAQTLAVSLLISLVQGAAGAGGAEKEFLFKGGGLMGPLVEAATPNGGGSLRLIKSGRDKWLGSPSPDFVGAESRSMAPWGIILASRY